MRTLESKKEETFRRTVSKKLVINEAKKSVALVIEDHVGYCAPVVLDDGTPVYDALYKDVRLPKVEFFSVREVKTYTAKPSKEDLSNYKAENGIMLVYCYDYYGSKTQFNKMCGKNDPVEFAKVTLTRLFGNVNNFKNQRNDLFSKVEYLDK